jgi:hypothetical protein
MKGYVEAVMIVCAVMSSCASEYKGIGRADAVALIGTTAPGPHANADSILARSTLDFVIPNPLVEDGISVSLKSDPSHENTIRCKAVLLDSVTTEADIASICRRDSLDSAAAAKFRETYLQEQVKPNQFRIRISMESGFSPKSLDPKFWVIFLMTSQGIAVEPLSVTSTPVVTKDDSVYSVQSRISMPRSLIRGDITLSFNRVTFFHEDLLGPDNPFIALELVKDRKTVARVVWKRSKDIR